MDSTSLTGQVVVVTGASSGIGRATATALSTAGAVLVLAARRAPELNSLAEDLAGPSLVVPCDVASEHDVAVLLEAVHARFGRIDGLVNNAGLATFESLVDTTLGEWQRMFDVNVTGSFLCARAVLPDMFERGDGWIVNVCSDVSKRVFPGGGAYCASKFAQYALSLALGQECRPRGVRVGAVPPGMVGTDFGGSKPAERASWVLRPEDVAQAILFMATRPHHAVVDELTVHPVQQEY